MATFSRSRRVALSAALAVVVSLLAQTEPAAATPAADVGITVQAPAAPTTGSNFDYTITVTNHGPDGATNVSVTDTLPSQVTFQSVSPGTCAYSSGTVTCALGALTNGASTTVTITVTRNDGHAFTNSGSVSSDADPYSANNVDSATVGIDPALAADVGVAMQAPVSPPVTGSNFDYTVTVTNHGPATATNVSIRDDLPSGVTFQSVNPPACGYLNGNRRVTCYLGSLANASAVTITITVRRDSPYSFYNYAYLSSDLDPNLGNDSTYAYVGPDYSAGADVEITMQAPASPATGTNFDYTINVTNHGPATATGVSVNVYLPSEVTFQSVSSVACAYLNANKVVVCNLGSLANGTTVSITITVRRDVGLGFSNSAYVSSDLDSNSNNNSASAYVQVDPAMAADVGVTMQAPQFPPATGSNFDYTITVTNHGPNTATNVNVTDYLPSEVTFQSVSPVACAYLNANKVVTCDLGSLANAAAVTITITVRRDTGRGFSNYAHVRSDIDLDSSNDYDSVYVDPDPTLAADVGVVMQAPQFPPATGSNFDYTITVTNHGPNTATNVSVNVYLPSEVTFESATPGSCTYSRSEVDCDLGSLANNATSTLIITVKRERGWGFWADAYVYSDVDLDRGNNDSDVYVSPDPTLAADVGITTEAPDSPATGSNFDYTLTVTNHGPNAATHVKATDYLPSEVTFQAATGSSCSYAVDSQGPYVACDLGSLVDGATTTITITVRRDQGSAFDNTASVSSDIDLNPDNDSDFATVAVDPSAAADLGISIEAAPPAPAVGSNFVYSISVTNNGPSTAAQIKVSDFLPTNVAYQSVSPISNCWYLNGNRVVRCKWASLANGASRAITITVKRKDVAGFDDSASVTSSLDLNGANDSDSVTVMPLLNLTVSKAGDGLGSVTSTPPGIDCGTTCQALFAQGSSVTLTATPAGKSTFSGWSGACTGSSTTCVVTMDSAKALVAAFSPPPADLTVVVTDSEFSPAIAGVSQGATVWWSFSGPGDNSVTDSSGMALFDSGAKGPGTHYWFTFLAAGTYPYHCSLHPSVKGKIKVPLKVTPSSGGISTTFTVTWAAFASPAGFVFDIQVKRPGSTSWAKWKTGETSLSAGFVPDTGPGTYSFRARLRNSGNAASSGWSPTKSVTVI